MPAPRLRRFAPAPLVLVLLLALSACDSGTDDPPVNDAIQAGLNFTRLFAPATPAEVAAVRAEWAARTPAAAAITVSAPATAPDGAQIYVVSHQMTSGPGAPLTHYGFVRVPAGAAGAPVLVVHHGGDDGVGASTVVGLSQLFPALFAETVQVFPSYRSEPLDTDAFEPVLGPSRTSGGSPSPWDYDVDDAMALLSAVLARDEFAGAVDAARVGALGFSRGGNTALLHAARDARVDAVTDYFGPADFYNAGAQQLALALVGGFDAPTQQGALGLPGARFLLDEVLDPLRNADGSYNAGADYPRARLEVLRRSASQFTSGLRNVQVHHHRRDGVVPFAFSVAFDAAAQAARPAGAYEFNAYGEAPTAAAPAAFQFHDPAAMPESLPDTEAFLRLHVVGAPTARVAAAY